MSLPLLFWVIGLYFVRSDQSKKKTLAQATGVYGSILIAIFIIVYAYITLVKLMHI
jgi:hypothetical protein